MKIEDKTIGQGNPCYVIAEIGINHNGSIEIAKSLIDAAINARVDAVKFQKRQLSSLYADEVLKDPSVGEQGLQYLVPILKQFELSDADFREIFNFCKKRNITFLCSPWDLPSIDFLEELGVCAYKVASADLTNMILLKKLAEKNKPLILSTGMSTIEEIEYSYNFLKKQENLEFAFLHCNSTYPAPFHNLNINFIEEMQKRFDIPIGYSGHEHGIIIPVAAICKGACIIEKHLTLDRTMKGPDHASSLEPQGFIKMVRDIRNVELSFGTKHKWVSRGEILNREVLGKSLVSDKDIKKGQIITEDAISVKSPAKGISPQKINELAGKTAVRDIKKGEFFREEDMGIKSVLSYKNNLDKKIGFIVRFNDIDHIKQDDLSALEFHLSDMDIDLTKILKINRLFKQELVIHAPEYWGDFLVDLASKDKDLNELSLDVIRKTIDITKRIKDNFEGSKNKKIKMVVHPGGMSREFVKEDKNAFYKILAKSVQRLKDTDIEILLENMPPLPWYFGGQWVHNIFMDADEIADYCRENEAGIVYDISHAQLYCNYEKIDIGQYTEKLLPFIRHIHIADAAGWDGEGLQIGEGEVDFKKVLNILKDLDVIFVPEIWQGHRYGGEGFIKAMDKL
ncbi:MAG: N-acetylneuraminate synthase family protein, partial [Actinobacteria bacterium]|nr:N-acetylneuraminate synthase family protein [Actinomycetota bacterium]